MANTVDFEAVRKMGGGNFGGPDDKLNYSADFPSVRDQVSAEEWRCAATSPPPTGSSTCST